MPTPKLNLDDIQKQIDTVLDDAKARLAAAKSDEHAIRLRINQVEKQCTHQAWQSRLWRI